MEYNQRIALLHILLIHLVNKICNDTNPYLLSLPYTDNLKLIHMCNRPKRNLEKLTSLGKYDCQLKQGFSSV